MQADVQPVYGVSTERIFQNHSGAMTSLSGLEPSCVPLHCKPDSLSTSIRSIRPLVTILTSCLHADLSVVVLIVSMGGLPTLARILSHHLVLGLPRPLLPFHLSLHNDLLKAVVSSHNMSKVS